MTRAGHHRSFGMKSAGGTEGSYGEIPRLRPGSAEGRCGPICLDGMQVPRAQRDSARVPVRARGCPVCIDLMIAVG